MSHIKTNIAQLEQMAPVILTSAQRKPLVLVMFLKELKDLLKMLQNLKWTGELY